MLSHLRYSCYNDDTGLVECWRRCTGDAGLGMLMLEPLSHSSWLIPVAKEAYKSRAQIATSWERALTQIKGRKIEIAITGLSGAGKTVLLDHLTGQAFHRGYKPPGRSRALEKGKVPAKGFRISLSTIPGQDSRPRLAALSEVFEAKYPVDGVIHVVSNGFISLREHASQQVLISDLRVDTIEKLRQHFLEEELSDLEETLGYIRKSLRKLHKPTWMVIAVAKSDLFYDKIDEAERYYSPTGSGSFVQKMQSFMNQVGSDNFDWEAVPVAAWLEDFHWGSEQLPSQFRPEQRDHFVGQFAEVLEKNCGS